MLGSATGFSSLRGTEYRGDVAELVRCPASEDAAV